MEVKAKYLQACILLVSVSATVGISYVLMDYYMNPSTSETFGGVCDDVLESSSMLINSHINPFQWFDYGEDKDCMMTLDAGSMPHASYKLEWRFFDLEDSDNCTKDYLKIYDSDMTTIGPSNLIGTYCGSVVNFTVASGRYLTLHFHTDSSGSAKGFRLMGLRFETPPCQSDEFHCTQEDVCIDDRLECDGTQHCDDDFDESGCSSFEEFIGSIVALGMGGMVIVGIAVCLGCTCICSLICACTCCKDCCTKCCCCWPCCQDKPGGKRGKGGKGKVGSSEW